MRSFRRLLVIAAVAATTSCGASPAEKKPHDEPPLGRKVKITGNHQYDFPVAKYELTREQKAITTNAAHLLMADCAREYGVHQLNPEPPGYQPTLKDEVARRYGLVNKAEAEIYGYPAPDRPGSKGSSKEGGQDPSALEQEVLEGKDSSGKPSTLKSKSGKPLPKDGCAAEGWRRLWGEGRPEDGIIDQLMGDAWALTKADSRALEAEKNWSSCMKKKGYDFQHRWDAGNSAYKNFQSDQLVMANQDLDCALETGYIDTWYAVDLAYQKRLLAQRAGQFDELSRQQDRVLKKAEEVVRR